MKKIVGFFILFIFFGFVTPNRKVPIITWSTKQLTWDDFKGKMSFNDSYDALTLSAISSSFSGDNSSLNFKVKAIFMPKGSKKKEERQTEKLLKHEQIHFDITEVYARKLRKELQEKKYTSFKRIRTDVNKIYDKVNLAWKKNQTLYDRITKHSKEEVKQVQWNTKIKNLLIELEDYKETDFKVDISYLK